jgi:hypothetical protein
VAGKRSRGCDAVTFQRFDCKGGTWDCSEAQIADWTQIYEGVNVRLEVRKAWAWIDANPTRMKKASGMKRFLVNWLNRCRPGPVEKRGDWYGHWPPCESWKACTERILADARAEREKV